MNAHAPSWKRFSVVLVTLALVFAFVAHQYLGRYSLSSQSLVAIYLCFVLLLVLALAPAVEAIRSFIPSLFPGRKKLAFIAFWLLPYLIYAAGTGNFQAWALLRLLAIAAPAPLLYAAFPVRTPSQFTWQDAILGAWLMTAVLAHGLTGIWTVPNNLHGINLDFMGRLFLIAVAASTWTFIRPVPNLGYRFRFNRSLLPAVALNFSLFALIAFPLGTALHFVAWNPHWRGALPFALDYLEIFLFIALLEELFFRGFLQNLLSSSFRAPWQGQLLASCLFGLSHIFHAPAPNWRYVILASIAGWFYGSAFRSGGGIFASGLTHALVDTAWRTWFSLR